MSCASLRPTRPLGARSLALLRRFTAVPRSPASMMRCTCRSGTPVTEAASFAVIRVVGLVATLKSFHIFGKIYGFRSQFASALDCWILVRSSVGRPSRSRPIPEGAMWPAPGLRLLRHPRPGKAELCACCGRRSADRHAPTSPFTNTSRATAVGPTYRQVRARRNGRHGSDGENRVGLREIRRVSRCEISQAGRDALAWARFSFRARFNFLVHPAGSRKYGGGSCNPSVLRSYFAPA